jgi:hypothetical protein
MLLSIDLHEDFIDVKGITVALMLSPQSSSVDSSKFDAPEADSFVAHSNAAFSQQAFNIAMTQLKTVVEPDSIGDDIRVGAPSRNRRSLYILMVRF